jgi:CHAT domain-containing protein
MLNLDEERQVIEQALECNPRIQASFLPQASSEALLADTGQVHLFHFAGHGDFETWTGSTPGTMGGEGVLIFDDGYGDPAPITASQLALQLRKLGVRIAVLGACRSGRRDNVNTWSSVATALLKAEVGAVVGMQHMIRDDSAIVFAKHFYRALLSGVTIDEALASGRIAMAQIDPKGWATPVLYLRAPDGVIFPEYEADSTLEKEREQLRVNARQQVKEVYGKLTGVNVKTMKEGTIEAEQNIGTVGKGGEATAVEIDEMSGGTVEAEQKVDTIESGGSMTGVSIDS